MHNHMQNKQRSCTLSRLHPVGNQLSQKLNPNQRSSRQQCCRLGRPESFHSLGLTQSKARICIIIAPQKPQKCLRFLWGYNYAFCRNFKNTQIYVLEGYVRLTKERIGGRGISWVSSSLGTFCKWLCDHHEDISRPRPGLAFCASAGWLWARLGQTCWPDATAAGSAAFCSSARTRTYSVYTVHWDIPCVHTVHSTLS